MPGWRELATGDFSSDPDVGKSVAQRLGDGFAEFGYGEPVAGGVPGKGKLHESRIPLDLVRGKA
jgi:hypothetical protein